MADRNLELALRMRADLQQARRQLQQVEQELGDVARGGGKAGQGMRRYTQETDKAERSSRRLSGTVGQVRNLLATLGAGLALRQMVRYTDTMTGLESQLRLVTGSQDEFNQTFADLYQLANSTRQGLEPTVNLYARMARATEELNLSNEELLTLTKAINQSYIVSGASAQEAAASTLQLSQAMASGVLRGEELNSVLENSPRLARAIADALGVTIGRLREMGQNGELTAEQISRALLESADSIDREFQTMERTVGQALQQLRNDLLVTFGGSEVTGFTDAIDDLRAVVTDPGFQQSMVTLGTAVADLVAAMAQGISTGTNFAAWAGEELAALTQGVAGDDIIRLEQRADEIRGMLDTPSRSLAGQGDRLRFFGPTGVVEYWDDEELKSELARLEGQIESYYANRPPITIDITEGQRGEEDQPESPRASSSGGSSSGLSAAAREYQAALQALQQLDQGLQQQIATFGESEAAALEYRLTLGDLADDVARLGAEGQALAASIVEQAREIERLTEAEERRAEAERERQQAQQQAEQALQQILDQADPARALERQLELIEELKTQFPEYAAALDQAAAQVSQRIDEINQGLLSARNINAEFAYGATDALTSFAEDIANGRNAIDSLADAFRQFAADFLLQIARMIMQQAIFNALQTMGGGGGGIGGAIASLFHGGGVVGQGGTTRDLFGTAPRYHTGGVAGLAPDEVPAILRRGEEVLTAADPRHRNNEGGTGQQSVSVKNVNVFDSAEVLNQAMSDTAGQKVILNYIKANRSAVRSALGS
ncbi:tape measure protein [Halomonas sp. SSL-5]|uniref:tape measure protein n=1 Tax=Halomonas sp. SSL-5 TaxID=3065855 RepID=UPI002739BC2E|nr:tape measure protein [Halomonas sp. SSL-5]MDY7117125.1 tape measure protein [Halomonas sp. SSL-5]